MLFVRIEAICSLGIVLAISLLICDQLQQIKLRLYCLLFTAMIKPFHVSFHVELVFVLVAGNLDLVLAVIRFD